MPMNLQKSFKSYLLKMKSRIIFCSFSSRNHCLRYCNQPRTSSSAIDRKKSHHVTEDVLNNMDQSANLADIDRFLRENFRSLYLSDNGEDEDERENSGTEEGVESINLSRSSSTQEFVFQDGGSKNLNMAPQYFGSIPNGVKVDIPTSSITNSKDIGSSLVSNKTLNKFFEISDEKDGIEITISHDYIATSKYSPTPYDDFRSSMQEIMDFKLQSNAKIDWEDMEELLFYYLKLNDKKSYEFILSSFIDTMSVWRERTGQSSTQSQNLERGTKDK
ncbi:hypothetical protein ACFE04_008551 [Oxalis oulophora]